MMGDVTTMKIEAIQLGYNYVLCAAEELSETRRVCKTVIRAWDPHTRPRAD